MDITVILTTYNRPDCLLAVLEGYKFQTDIDFRIVIADDGSTIETKRVIDNFKKHAPFGLHHVWHEDSGFRVAAIRNRALAETYADYIIFSDGDCIPLPGFVAMHRSLAEKGWFVSGNRVLLSADFSERVLKKDIPVYSWTRSKWFFALLKHDINRINPFFSLPAYSWLRKVTANRWNGVMTCNLSAWRNDLIAVNGFDETYAGWGLEDSDLVIRLLHRKVRHKSARFTTPVLHLWHRENDRKELKNNQKRFNKLLESDRTQAILGINQYL